VIKTWPQARAAEKRIREGADELTVWPNASVERLDDSFLAALSIVDDAKELLAFYARVKKRRRKT